MRFLMTRGDHRCRTIRDGSETAVSVVTCRKDGEVVDLVHLLLEKAKAQCLSFRAGASRRVVSHSRIEL